MLLSSVLQLSMPATERAVMALMIATKIENKRTKARSNITRAPAAHPRLVKKDLLKIPGRPLHHTYTQSHCLVIARTYVTEVNSHEQKRLSIHHLSHPTKNITLHRYLPPLDILPDSDGISHATVVRSVIHSVSLPTRYRKLLLQLGAAAETQTYLWLYPSVSTYHTLSYLPTKINQSTCPSTPPIA